MDALDQYLSTRADWRFDWRTHNCAHFAGAWVAIKSGRDHVAPWLHLMFANTRAALRRLKAEGGYLAVADRALGPHMPGTYAARGDVVLLSAGKQRRFTGSAWGICVGNRIAALGPTGLLLLPIDQARAAWRV